MTAAWWRIVLGGGNDAGEAGDAGDTGDDRILFLEAINSGALAD